MVDRLDSVTCRFHEEDQRLTVTCTQDVTHIDDVGVRKVVVTPHDLEAKFDAEYVLEGAPDGKRVKPSLKFGDRDG